jgi:hypothetical protein
MRANCMRANFFSAALPSRAATCGEGAELRRLPPSAPLRFEACPREATRWFRARLRSRLRSRLQRETRGDGEPASMAFTRSKATGGRLSGTTSSAPHGVLVLSATARAPPASGAVARAATRCPPAPLRQRRATARRASRSRRRAHPPDISVVVDLVDLVDLVFPPPLRRREISLCTPSKGTRFLSSAGSWVEGTKEVHQSPPK